MTVTVSIGNKKFDLTKSKETKNNHVYTQEKGAPFIATVYVSKKKS